MPRRARATTQIILVLILALLLAALLLVNSTPCLETKGRFGTVIYRRLLDMRWPATNNCNILLSGTLAEKGVAMASQLCPR